MGHQQLAGYLSEYTMGGCSFLRLDVPETEHQPAFTKLFKDNAIYSIDPVDEETARYQAGILGRAPIEGWDFSKMLQKQIENRGQVPLNKKDLPEGFLLPQKSQINDDIADCDFDEDEGHF